MTNHAEIAKKLANAIGPTPTDEEFIDNSIQFYKWRKKAERAWSWFFIGAFFAIAGASAKNFLPDPAWWEILWVACALLICLFFSHQSIYALGRATARLEEFETRKRVNDGRSPSDGS